MRESIGWTLFAGAMLMFGIVLAAWQFLVNSHLPYPF